MFLVHLISSEFVTYEKKEKVNLLLYKDNVTYADKIVYFEQ